jgi:RND family efflux transporter MFP subunit
MNLMENTFSTPDLADPEKDGIIQTSRPRLGRLALLIALLIGGAALAGFLPRWRDHKALVAESRELAVTTVSVTRPSPAQATAPMLLPAEIKPFLEASIHARASGYVKKWLADIGSEVESGQILAEIDSPELSQELSQGRAQLLQAQAAFELAQTTAARWAELLKTESVSQQEEAEKRADLALKSATVEAARANVRRLEDLQGFTHITAPFAGTVTARNIDVGDLVSANSGRELFHLAQTKTLRVFARVPQTSARSIASGQTADVLIPELPRQVFHARVARTSGVMNPASRTLLVELELENNRRQVLSGSFAQVRFADQGRDAPITVPGTTLIFRAEGTQVAVVQDNVARLRNIQLGRDFGPRVEVISGLSTNDLIVANPPDALASGMKVRVLATPKEEAVK